MTTEEYVNYVALRVTNGAPAGNLRPMIESIIPMALQRLADRISDDPNPRIQALLQKTVSLTLSGGEVEPDDDVLAGAIGRAYIILSGSGAPTEPLQWLPTMHDLVNFQYPDYAGFTYDEGLIKVRRMGAIPAATSLSVRTSFIPSLGEVPSELEDNLIDVGVELVLESGSLAEVEQEAHNVG